MIRLLFLSFIFLIAQQKADSQACTPQGDETAYGNNNVWRGYFYDNADFTNYRGFQNEGSPGSPNFDQNFGGSNTTYSTNGCSIQTETFSVRYKLRTSFSNGSYNFTVGGDDGYRLSLDGGATWVINRWVDQSYTTSTYTGILNGSYDIVLEYYENGGDNRISFTLSGPCATENTNIYGTNNTWNGYLYQGMNFNAYVGMVHEGITSNPNFTEGFGGNNVLFATSGCNVQTENFSMRLRLTKTFLNGDYTFFVGGDDGYRLSVDGGNTWIIDNWRDQSYNLMNTTVHLNGTYNLVLEYYENGGDNTLSFAYQISGVLAVKLISFGGIAQNNSNELNWNITTSSDPDHFELQRSSDGINFITAANVPASAGQNDEAAISYHYSDKTATGEKTIYRLKMVDVNGAITYSNIISITRSFSGDQPIKLYPTTITNHTINIQSSVALNNAVLAITDMQGKTISRRVLGRLSAGQVLSVPTGTNSATHGMYLVRVIDDRKVITSQKILIR